jgi:hypothetical protein
MALLEAKDPQLGYIASTYTIWEIDAALAPWRKQMRALNEELTTLGVFPGLFIFHRQKAGKPRKAKSATTRDQNNYGVLAAPVLSLNDYGTVVRIAKHRGYGQLVSVVSLTPEEALDYSTDKRATLPKYKNFHELYLRRGNMAGLLADPGWKQVSEQLEKLYPSRATGQLKMF